MREKGQLIKCGSLSAEGDVEFWDDGTATARSSNFIPQPSDPSEKDRLREKPAGQDLATDSDASSHQKS
jgi:mitochondrial protein import protein ZIM17